ncbi:hypothetical protein ACFLS9_05975 [Bacteroidota bacterium]
MNLIITLRYTILIYEIFRYIKFLYYVPFPNAEFLSVADIKYKADVELTYSPEIIDLVNLLEEYKVLEQG